MLYYHKSLPKIRWIIFNIVLEIGFTNELGPSEIPYYFSISDFINSRPIHYYPLLYVISIGH